ncbi:MAG: hypothetical protein KY460_17235 [Actinobacteria bacterium]|nr:hypothetical protein [Actinomycetota bacterium]
MTNTTIRRGTAAHAAGTLVVLYAITFLLGAVLHLGVAIPLGVTVLTEPVIIPAAIVESFCALGLAISGYALFARKRWAWLATIAAHGFALAGVLLGMAALAAGRGPSTVLNNAYHLTMLVLLAGGLVTLATGVGRRALASTDAAS